MTGHKYPRTERDLRALAVGFSTGKIQRGLPERLEALAAALRVYVESTKAVRGEPHDFRGAVLAENAAVDRLRAAGVLPGEGEFTFSPCMGPDAPEGT